MPYQVKIMKYDGGDDYEIESHGQFHDYQDAVASAGEITDYHTFIYGCEEIWNSSQGEKVHPMLIKKICNRLTEIQRAAVVEMVDRFIAIST
jgi:hypothetical protein